MANRAANDVANLVEQRIPEQGLFDDRDVGFLGLLAQRQDSGGS